MKKRPASTAAELAAKLRDYALALPGAREEFPWGESVAKVGKKVFVFLGRKDDDTFGMSVKLPSSAAGVLQLPFATPTGYGLGKAGWVSISAEPASLPLELLCQWVEESYRAIAPKKLIAQLDRAGTTGSV